MRPFMKKSFTIPNHLHPLHKKFTDFQAYRERNRQDWPNPDRKSSSTWKSYLSEGRRRSERKPFSRSAEISCDGKRCRKGRRLTVTPPKSMPAASVNLAERRSEKPLPQSQDHKRR
ncbi:unnamed protein product [Cuscuta epithymum]|uniref:Uncharacterized protein n=1 Tax=Cuscuta epithymum TaxID=186058 RepID=A0AAV0E1C0_9ASTE|nr:unnamed protein product [Cuscuta epithymum]